MNWKHTLIIVTGSLLAYVIYVNSNNGEEVSFVDSFLGKNKLALTKDSLELTPQKENIPKDKAFKETIIKALSMKEAVLEYIKYQNSSDYENSYKFMQKKDKSKETYLNYWKKHKEQFILYSIDEKNHTFKVIIDYEDGYNKDVFCKFYFEQDNGKWYVKENIEPIQDLEEFDRWKSTKSEKLHFIDKNISTGKVYALYPKTTSKYIKTLHGLTKVKAYVDTVDGRFYLDKQNFDKLINNDKFNWIHSKD